MGRGIYIQAKKRYQIYFYIRKGIGRVNLMQINSIPLSADMVQPTGNIKNTESGHFEDIMLKKVNVGLDTYIELDRKMAYRFGVCNRTF